MGPLRVGFGTSYVYKDYQRNDNMRDKCFQEWFEPCTASPPTKRTPSQWTWWPTLASWSLTSLLRTSEYLGIFFSGPILSLKANPKSFRQLNQPRLSLRSNWQLKLDINRGYFPLWRLRWVEYRKFPTKEPLRGWKWRKLFVLNPRRRRRGRSASTHHINKSLLILFTGQKKCSCTTWRYLE